MGKNLNHNVWVVIFIVLTPIVTGGVIVGIVMGKVAQPYLRTQRVRAAERDRIIHALEAYRDQHGRYPPDLADAGAVPDAAVYPYSWYWVRKDGEWMDLSIGPDGEFFRGSTRQYSNITKRWDLVDNP